MRFLWLSICFAFFASGCSHFYKVRTIPLEKDQIALEGVTGTHGESLYKDLFAAKAKSICENGNFEIIEQSHTPKIFECAHSVLDPEKYYWVIRCKK